MSRKTSKRKLGKNAIIAIAIICALVFAGIATGFYTNYSAIIKDKDETIESLNSEVIQLRMENSTDAIEALNVSLHSQIQLLQNQIENDNSQIYSLNRQIDTLQSALNSGNQTDEATAQVRSLQQQVEDMQSQIYSKDDKINSLIRLNMIDALNNFNDSAVWLDQTKGTFTQVVKQEINAGTTMSITGLNLVQGKAYYVTINMVMIPPTIETSTAYLYVNGDTNKTHYDTSYLYGNARWPTVACFQYENDPRIFDNGQFAGPMGIIFTGVLEIDPIGTLRMALTYNAYDNLRSDIETGLYGWIYNGATVSSVNRFDINSTMPITGTFAIYDMEP